jgi:predicted RNase H-like HicB family nuclease
MAKKQNAVNGGKRGAGKGLGARAVSPPNRLDDLLRELERARAQSDRDLKALEDQLRRLIRQGPRLRVKVMIYPAEEGGYWAQVPALPGCITEGDTREELLANLREALQGYLLSTSGAFRPEPGGSEEEVEL